MAACTKVARGIANPTAIPPYNTPSAPSKPFDDTVNNNPCGEYTVTSVNGVDVSAHGLCLFHLGMKLGLDAIKGPVVISTS